MRVLNSCRTGFTFLKRGVGQVELRLVCNPMPTLSKGPMLVLLVLGIHAVVALTSCCCSASPEACGSGELLEEHDPQPAGWTGPACRGAASVAVSLETLHQCPVFVGEQAATSTALW